MSNVKSVTDENFTSEVMEHNGLVLVDFWGPGCGPCRMIAPIIDAISGENETLKVVKVNVSEAPQVANQFQITSIPTLIFIKNGNVLEQFIGVVQKQKLQAVIDENLA
ncbi:MAG: thioredoxin [Planctomycetia bacterium]|nr:thioredoxin [Planctomycetia bacterium]